MSAMIHHRVQPGETLREIAFAYYKDASLWSVIYRHNKHYIPDPSVLQPGQFIVIPHVAR